jgi:hypothetical protein
MRVRALNTQLLLVLGIYLRQQSSQSAILAFTRSFAMIAALSPELPVIRISYEMATNAPKNASWSHQADVNCGSSEIHHAVCREALSL